MNEHVYWQCKKVLSGAYLLPNICDGNDSLTC